MKILVLNAGSSSQKSALFELSNAGPEEPLPPLWEGKLQWERGEEELHIRNASGREIRRQGRAGAPHESLAAMLQNLWNGPAAVLSAPLEIGAAGHRIVHGGPKLTQPARITAEVKREIESVAAIAPLHNEAGLQGIALAQRLFPDAPQIAVFDTGFHRTLPREAYVYALPYSWYQQEGIRRYGFHGINHEYCAGRAAHLLGRDRSSLKLITCHLGNGCSLAAIDAGKSIDTTMGFTPLEGLMMGTRSGSVDPGVLIHAMRSNSLSANPDSLDRTLNHESGLLGISGVASDMRDVVAAAARGNDRANLAFDIFVHRLCSGIGSMAASLAGLDALVFTAGIGQNSADVRRSACAKLGFLGIKLDPDLNAQPQPVGDISHPESATRVLVIPANEEWAIAKQSLQLISRG
jgi:acetate kinase